MQENLQKRAQLEKSRRWILAGTAAAIIVALLITIAILDSQLEAAALRSDQVLLSITQELQSELVFALRSYNGIYSTGADVDGSILPTVRQHLNTATALNNILTNGFGSAYSVFTQDLYNRLEHFYSEYELARSAKDISLKDVIDVVEGPWRLTRCADDSAACNRSAQATCAFRREMCRISQRINEELAAVDFAALAARK